LLRADSEQTIRAISNGFVVEQYKMAAASGFTTQTQLSTIIFIERPADCSRHSLDQQSSCCVCYESIAKRFELLHQVAPSADTIA
jgi:hypothetical protein